jgi:hypothetical protein
MKGIKVRAAILATTIAATALSMTAVAIPSAHAATGCGNGNICLYEVQSTAGAPGWWQSGYSAPDLSKAKFHDGKTVNNARAIFNNEDWFECFYGLANYQGYPVCLKPHSTWTNLGGFDRHLFSFRPSVTSASAIWAIRTYYGYGEPAIPNAVVGWPAKKPVPYSLGGHGALAGPSLSGGVVGTDCSGFTRWMYRLATNGRDVLGAGGSDQQAGRGTHISASQAVPGDLVFWMGHHVGMYLSPDTIINETNPKGGMKISSISSTSTYFGGEQPVYVHYNF